MADMSSNRGGNVVPFPDLSKRLLDKAVNALKDKKHAAALELLEQLERIDPGNPQGAYGLAVCYVELGKYDKAEELTGKMMEKGIGNYYDVLKLHITVLIQCRRYEKVISILEAVQSEEDIPVDIRQTLHQLAHFASSRLEEEPPLSDMISSADTYSDSPFLGSGVDNEPDVDESFSQVDLDKALSSDDSEQQWVAIRKARHNSAEPVTQQLKNYLMSDTGDPFLKSMVIKDLQDRGDQGTVSVKKFESVYKIDLSGNLFYESFADDVQELLDDTLASNNPTLQSLAVQLWGHFVLSVYPQPLDSKNPKVWAGACYVFVHRINGMEIDSETLYELFGVTEEEISKPITLIKYVEENAPARD